ncbi:MAG TPA: DUF268 domain-containing protein [Steroidobacteraceae bacterium]|jgi:hypothetical protein|nr:DUF268 domain-containing protein [Steroidobacteraceae bacterium]
MANDILKSMGRSLSAVGINARALLSLRHAQRYFRQARRFRRQGGQITHRYPILTDYDDSAGAASGHYFHQDLLVASLVHTANPARHIDVGSRIDGFVAHIAAFRKIEVLDIRPLADTGHDNTRFLRADLMDRTIELPRADSVSCLHAIEHFGLGRYGDPVEPDGHRRGLGNLLRMVEPGGSLYLSFPIGRRNEVHFNAHRVFHPRDVFEWARAAPLSLLRFDYVDDVGRLHRRADPLQDLAVDYGCGIYTFRVGHAAS